MSEVEIEVMHHDDELQAPVKPASPSNDISGDIPDVYISWKDLSFDVKLKDGSTKTIIKNSFGEVKPSEVMAILGPSGSGKSTLLNLLLGSHIRPTKGEFLINGKPRSKYFKYISSYVPQDDNLIPVLTVRETIEYSARLRCPSVLSRERIRERVSELISDMGLNNCADTKVGNFLIRGVSGGQRRRVSIASELVTDPKVIVLDEPTSGLDSESARKIMEQLLTLAKKGRKTIVCTIHQPSSELFSQFDKVLLLSAGRTVYLGKASESVQFFNGAGYPCPEYYNPADHFLSILNTDFVQDQPKAGQNIDGLVQDFQASPQGKELMLSIEKRGQKQTEITNFSFARSHIWQTIVLTERSYKNAGRNVLLYWIRAAMYVCMAILMGTTWYDVGTDQSQVQDRFAAHFFAVAFLCFMSVAAIPGIIEEKAVFDREVMNAAYSVDAYVISNTLTSLPFIALIGAIFVAIAYPMLMLQSGFDKVMNFFVLLFLSLYTIESIVVVISALVPIFVVALALASFLNGFFMCVQGFFVRKSSLPDFWIWGHRWGYQTYAFEALVKSDFEGLTFQCGQACECIIPSSDPGSCTFSGLDVLKNYEYDEVSVANWMLVLVGQIVIYRLIFYAILRMKTRFRS